MPTKVSSNALLARMKAKALSDAKASEDAAAKAAVKLTKEEAKAALKLTKEKAKAALKHTKDQANGDQKQPQGTKRGRNPSQQDLGSESDDPEYWQKSQTTEKTKKSRK